MFTDTLMPGKLYVVRHSGNLVDAKFLRTEFAYGSSKRVHYVFLKMVTQREITLKSRQKIIRELN